MKTKNYDSFEEWMREVDRIIAQECMGLTSEDLADQPYYDWYDDGFTPHEAAQEALEENGWF